MKLKLTLAAAVLCALAFAAPALAAENTSPPLVSGEAHANETLSASTGSWSGETSAGFAYSWLRCDSAGANCLPIAGAASSSYTLQFSEIGFTVVASVTALDGPTSAASAPTAVVNYPRPAGGRCTLVPRYGDADATVFSVTCESWSDYFQANPLTYSYQWWGCVGETDNCSLEYTNPLTTTPQGESVVSGFFSPGGGTFEARVVICQYNGGCTTWTDIGYLSDWGLPHNNPSALPAISGNLWPGQTLVAGPGEWSNDPTGFSYQWHSCPESLPYDHAQRHADASYYGCTPIAGATAAGYTLSAAEVGSFLLVGVTATNANGPTLVVSPISGRVAASAAPLIAGISPAEGETVRGQGFLVLSGSDDVAVSEAAYSADDGASWVTMSTNGPNEWAGAVDFRNFANGAHSFQLRLTDADAQTAVSSRTLMIDNDAPANPLVTSPVVGSTITSSPTTFTIETADRVDQIVVYGDDNNFLGTAVVQNAERTLWTLTASIAHSPDQADFQLLIITSNSAGTVNYRPSFVLDLVLDAPQPSFASPLAGATVAGSFQVEITTDEQTDSVDLQIGDNWYSPSYDAGSDSWKLSANATGLPEGDLVLRAYATNLAGTLARTITVSAALVEEGGFGDPDPTTLPTPAPSEPTPAPAPAPTEPVVTEPLPPPSGQTRWGLPSDPFRQLIVSGSLDDVIRTGSGNDVIRSFGGNDRIFNGRGGGFVYAGSGNDVVWAQHGHARIYCGPGTDTLYANRFVRSLGCETVIVASNNRWTKVKLDRRGLPIMPRTFVRPYFRG